MGRQVIRRLAGAVLALGLVGAVGVPAAVAFSAITVNSLADVAANDGQCTLREAITSANTDTASGAAPGECVAGSGADQIHFSVSGTITLTSALPAISNDLLIAGNFSLTVSGAGTSQVFDIASGNVTLADLTITAGAALHGGAIRNGGSLVVVASTISGNTATAGGGIYNSGGTLTVMDSTISGNTTGLGGGGIFIAGGTATIANSTISANTAAQGGGVQDSVSGSLTITNSTITGNSATGLGGGGLLAAGTETLVNTIVAGNTAATIGPDIDFFAETVTTSVIGVPGGKTLADILVPGGPVNNGGQTKTIALALVAGNPAVDAGTSSVCAAAPVNSIDQRGLPRPAACDIGAYEAQPPSVAAHANVSVAVSPPAPTAVTYTLPTAADEQGGVLGVNCNPPSGSTFAVGTTTVTCTATDAVGHTTSRTFNVIVSAIAAPSPPAPTLPNGATASGRTGAPSPQTPLGVALVLLALTSLIGLVALGRSIGRRREESA